MSLKPKPKKREERKKQEKVSIPRTIEYRGVIYCFVQSFKDKKIAYGVARAMRKDFRGTKVRVKKIGDIYAIYDY